MKAFRLFFILTLIITGTTGFSQVATLQVSGHVTELQSGLPVDNHLITVIVYPDSLNLSLSFSDSVFTDPSGSYTSALTVPYAPGTAALLIAGTLDCNMNWLHQTFLYTNNQSSFTADFSICTDTLPPPSPCENTISLVGIQDLTASFQGSVINGQAASYFWQLGDGTTANVQNPTHTYAQQGIYNVTLQTVTSDSCSDLSNFTLVLMDTIPYGCAGYFSAAPTGNPFEMAFQGFTQSPYPTDYTWQLGDGTTTSGQNPVHTYYCAGTYMVTLTTIDSTDCSYTYSASIIVPNDSISNFSLNGQVFEGNIPLCFGMVKLFGMNPAGSYTPVQTTFVDSSGFYNFWNVSTGTYLILAFPTPDSLSNNQYLPTYFGNVVFWEQATQISLGVPLNPYNINLVSYDSIGGGDGSIYGQLLNSGKSMLSGGQEVLLLDATGTPVGITYTNQQGYFGFASLHFGQYTVHPVITGIAVQVAPFVLSATNPSVVVIMTINGNIITGISKKSEASVMESIYPNPAIDQISIAIIMIGKVKIIISDATGRLMISETRNLYEAGMVVSIPVKELKPGLYFVSIQDRDGNISTERIIKN